MSSAKALVWGMVLGVGAKALWDRYKTASAATLFPASPPAMDYGALATYRIKSVQSRDSRPYDLVCDGSNDWEQIMTAVESFPRSGKRGERVGTIALSEGAFYPKRPLVLDGFVNLFARGGDYLLPTVLVPTDPIDGSPAFLYLRNDIGGRMISRVSIEDQRHVLKAGQLLLYVDEESRRTVLDQLWLRGDDICDSIRFPSQHTVIQHCEILQCYRGPQIEYRLNHVFNLRTTRCTYGLVLDLSDEYRARRGDKDEADYNIVEGYENVAFDGAVCGLYVNGVGNIIRWWDENNPDGYTPVLYGPKGDPARNDVLMLKDLGKRA